MLGGKHGRAPLVGSLRRTGPRGSHWSEERARARAGANYTGPPGQGHVWAHMGRASHHSLGRHVQYPHPLGRHPGPGPAGPVSGSVPHVPLENRDARSRADANVGPSDRWGMRVRYVWGAVAQAQAQAQEEVRALLCGREVWTLCESNYISFCKKSRTRTRTELA